MTQRALVLASLLLASLTSACDKQGAWGETNSIIFVSSPELWDSVRDTVKVALEPRVQTVRDELAFQVTYQDPAGQHWANLRRFKQLLLVGSAEETWMEPAIEMLESTPSGPAILQVHDVWARDQLVTLLLLPSQGDTQAVASLLPELSELFGKQYRDWAVSRMFLSGVDTAGEARLRREAGFSVRLPEVYQERTVDSVYVFRNDNPNPAELIREIVVSWRTPAPATIDQEMMLAWRNELSSNIYNYPQTVDLSASVAGPIERNRRQGYQIQAMWRNPPEANWPAGGPFILRAIRCPAQDRLYLVDTWLYAPGKQKYEYMIQLETILDSFYCG